MMRVYIRNTSQARSRIHIWIHKRAGCPVHARALRSSPLTSRVYHYRLTRLCSQARLLPALATGLTSIVGYDLPWMGNYHRSRQMESESRMDTPELVLTVIIALVGVLIILLLLNAQVVKQTPDNMSQRLAHIERKLDKIMAHLNIEIEPDTRVDASVEELVRAGKMIEASACARRNRR